MKAIKMKPRVTIQTKAAGGATVVTAAMFIPVEMLVRLGRAQGTRSDRSRAWRLDNRAHIRVYERARRTVAGRIDEERALP